MYLGICSLLQSQYGNVKVKYSKKIYGVSIVIGIILALLFYFRWKPSSLVYSLSNRVHLNVTFTLIVLSFDLLVASLHGICRILYFAVDYCENYKDMKLVKWIRSDSSTFKSKIICSVILALLFWIFQGSVQIYAELDNYQISQVLNGLYSTDNYNRNNYLFSIIPHRRAYERYHFSRWVGHTFYTPTIEILYNFC
jgi:hypothetical protein